MPAGVRRVLPFDALVFDESRLDSAGRTAVLCGQLLHAGACIECLELALVFFWRPGVASIRHPLFARSLREHCARGQRERLGGRKQRADDFRLIEWTSIRQHLAGKRINAISEGLNNREGFLWVHRLCQSFSQFSSRMPG